MLHGGEWQCLNPLSAGHFFKPVDIVVLEVLVLGLNPLSAGHFFKLRRFKRIRIALSLNPLSAGHFFKRIHVNQHNIKAKS